jgi:hypothetical protein
MGVPGATLARVTETRPPSNKHAHAKIAKAFPIGTIIRKRTHSYSARAEVLAGDARRIKGGAVTTPPQEACYYWIFTAKMITAD